MCVQVQRHKHAVSYTYMYSTTSGINARLKINSFGRLVSLRYNVRIRFVYYNNNIIYDVVVSGREVGGGEVTAAACTRRMIYLFSCVHTFIMVLRRVEQIVRKKINICIIYMYCIYVWIRALLPIEDWELPVVIILWRVRSRREAYTLIMYTTVKHLYIWRTPCDDVMLCALNIIFT